MAAMCVVVAVVIGTIHEAIVWSNYTLETQNVTAVIGRNFSSVLSEHDFSLERLAKWFSVCAKCTRGAAFAPPKLTSDTSIRRGARRLATVARTLFFERTR